MCTVPGTGVRGFYLSRGIGRTPQQDLGTLSSTTCSPCTKYVPGSQGRVRVNNFNVQGNSNTKLSSLAPKPLLVLDPKELSALFCKIILRNKDLILITPP